MAVPALAPDRFLAGLRGNPFVEENRMMVSGETLSRRGLMTTIGGACGTALLGNTLLAGAARSQDATDPRVAEIIADTITVDMHNHDGQPQFAKNPADLKPDPNVDLRGQMIKAGLSAICLTYAVDGYRTPQVGDWYRFHLQCLAHDDRLLARNGMRRALTVADLKAAHATKTPIAIQDCEGAQWIEGHLERIAEAYKRGLRHMQLLHQMHDLVAPLGGVQQLVVPPGSTQKAPAVTGLTAFGAEVIRECNRLGIVVDMAHGDEETVLGALKAARQPLVVTHTAFDSPIARTASNYVSDPGLIARLVSRAYVKAVADAGGIVGVWHIFPTLKDYVTGIRQMVEVAGVDHVGIGTDTSVAPRPRGDSARPGGSPRGNAAAPAGRRGAAAGLPPGGTNQTWPDEKGGFMYAVAREMLAQGFTAPEISKITGGNYVRIFEKVTAGHA